MGGGSWSNADYEYTKSARFASTGVDKFAYDAGIKKGIIAPKVAPTLNFASDKTVKLNGVGVRESRDNAEHPESNAIIVGFDVTGSMGNIPRVLQDKLPKLMSTLLTKAYLTDPQILMAAVGDAYCDKAPIQLGQFESDVKIDENLNDIWLEGGGGGSTEESYDLLLYFAARHTAIDCFEKRGKKGYLFLIGDEKPYNRVNKDQVKKHLDHDLQADIPFEDIVKEAEEKYEVFFINPSECSYGNTNMPPWKAVLGQRVLDLADANLVCETIVAAIGVNEGIIDGAGDLRTDLGMSDSDARTVDNAIALIKTGRKNELATATVGGGTIARTGSDNVESL